MRPALLLLLLSAYSCAPDDGRAAQLINALTRADEYALRGRPLLMSGKYARMSGGLFDFYRGSLPLARTDWERGVSSRSSFGRSEPFVWGLGDPHPENFGLLHASDESAALEPNDFDGADRVPWLFDLRRLCAGILLAARLSNPADPIAARAAWEAGPQIVRRTTAAYVAAMAQAAQGHVPRRIDDPGTGAVLQDLFTRGARDLAARSELTTLTVVDQGHRRLIRGGIDPAEPTQSLGELPPSALAQLPGVLKGLGLGDRAQVLDAAREFGSGVASWPRVRAIVLLRGPTDSPDDDVLVEVKELGESGFAGWYPPLVPADDAGQRVWSAARRAWARPDADGIWSEAVWCGLPVQVRTEADGNKGVRVSRLEKSRGAPEALAQLGETLGALLARVHSADGQSAPAIAAQLEGQHEAFAEEEVSEAVRAADQAQVDFLLFGAALQQRGPTLGFERSASDALAPDFAALVGVPP